MNDDRKEIGEMLSTVMREHNISADALSNATDIPKRFIDALIEGDFGSLPAKPYIRGYLFKIAEALRLDKNALWQSYKNSSSVAGSGEFDKLPANRFALKRMSTARVFAIFAVLILLVFLGTRFNDILGKPTIEIVAPEITNEETATVSGKVRAGDTLTLNGEVIYPNEDGVFEKRVQLQPGLNPLRFTVKRYLGREAVFDDQIFYQPEPIIPVSEEEQ